MSLVEMVESGRFGMAMQSASGFSKEPGGPGDAFRHIMASAYAANTYGSGIAQAMGEAAEIVGTLRNLVVHGEFKLGEAGMDLGNNAAGIELAERTKGDLHRVAEKALRAIHAELAGADGSVEIMSESVQTIGDLDTQIVVVKEAIDEFIARTGSGDA